MEIAAAYLSKQFIVSLIVEIVVSYHIATFQ